MGEIPYSVRALKLIDEIAAKATQQPPAKEATAVSPWDGASGSASESVQDASS